MTSDMGEMFNEHRKERAQKRRDNTRSSTELLTERGVPYESKNFGSHLVLQRGRHRIDFWPGTGLWHYRTPAGKVIKRRGVHHLLKQWAALAEPQPLDVTDPAEPAIPGPYPERGPAYARDLPF